MVYFQIQEGVKLPSIKEFSPSKVVLIIETEVSDEWKNLVSEWIVNSDSYYVMARGIDSSSWDDSVDIANIAQYESDIPNDKFVTITWHDDETLSEVFWFAKNCAFNEYRDFNEIIVLHVSGNNQASEFTQVFKNA